MPQTEVNLDRLRSEMMDYVRQTGLPIFYGLGNPDEEDYTFWDVRAFPDWRQFVDVGKECGARLLLFSSDTFADAELERVFEKLGECEMNSEDRVYYMKQFEALRKRVGQTAWVRLAFEQGGRWLAYEHTASWYEDFCSVLEDLETLLPIGEEEEEEEGGDASRGFFSRN